jgi:hypothetical protein
VDTTSVALLAFAGGSLMAAVISAFVKHFIFHPMISVRLDEKRGSYGSVPLPASRRSKQANRQQSPSEISPAARRKHWALDD